MGSNKRHLKFTIDFQPPIEIERVAVLFAELPHVIETDLNFLSDSLWIIDDDFVMLLCCFSKCRCDELVYLTEVRCSTSRPG